MNFLQRRASGGAGRGHLSRSWDSPKRSTQAREAAARSRRLCLVTTALVAVALLSIYSIRLGRLHPHPDLEGAPKEDLELVNKLAQAAQAAQGGGGGGAGGGAGEFTYFRLNQSATPVESAEKGIAAGVPPVPRGYDDIHIIFSTDCSDYQNWQSLLFFYSAARAGQAGPVTRLASGCTDEEMAALRAVHRSMPSHHRVHFTPDFSIDVRTGKRYPYYNKPRALRHWLARADPPVREAVVALLDPDMVLLRPLRPFVDDAEAAAGAAARFARAPGPGEPPVRGTEPWVREGHPAGQYYGLGGPWATWTDLAEIVQDPASPALAVPPAEAARHYPVGPPYLAHARDMAAIADKWVAFVARAFEGHPGILSEMYAFCIAAAHLRLPHRVVHKYMVSDTSVRGEEGWDLVEARPEASLCRDALGPPAPLLSPDAAAALPPAPAVLHYCHVFRSGVYMFGKRRKGLHAIFACDAPYLLEPPPYVGAMRVRVHPPDRVEPVDARAAARNAFALCAVTQALNEALRDYRRAHCGAAAFAAGLANVRQLTDLQPGVLGDAERWRREGAL